MIEALRSQVAEASAEAEEAARAAEAIRAIAEAHRSRPLLARLRAAWRGEY
jgi:hypothetical protein